MHAQVGRVDGPARSARHSADRVCIRSLGSLRAIWQELRLARYIARQRTQIVHTYNFYANVFGVPAAWLAGTPVIVASIRDRGVYLNTMQRHMQRLVCKLADSVLVNADSIREWLISDGYDPSRIVVIKNGIDLPRFGGPKNPALRAELGVPENVPIVAMLSRLTPMKGIEDLIDAAAIVSWQHPDVRFLIVGAGHVSDHGKFTEDHKYRQSIEDRVRRLGLSDRVLLTGHRHDVGDVLSEFTISVLPSLSEGLSNAVLESLASGVPVVATRVGGTPEAVDHGVTGLLVPPSDPQALATAITELLSDPARAAEMGAAGRRAMTERFGMDRMVHATEQLYLDLLVRKAAQPGLRRRIGLAPAVFEPLAGKRL